MSWLKKLGFDVKYEVDDPNETYVQRTRSTIAQAAETTGSNIAYWACAAVCIPAAFYVTFPNASRSIIDSVVGWFKNNEPPKTQVEKIEERRDAQQSVELDLRILP